MIKITDEAVEKIKSMMAQQDPPPAALRIGVQGGGCSGYQYKMVYVNKAGMMDKTFDFNGLTVYVDPTSATYLEGCEIDYQDTLEASGFSFNNPNATSKCGCGSSFGA